MYFDDSDEDDAKIGELWTFHPAPAEEEITETQRKEDILARKKSRKILETNQEFYKILGKISIYFPSENWLKKLTVA